MRKIHAHRLLVCLSGLALLLHSCSISRRIPENEVYFRNHEVRIEQEPTEFPVTADELLAMSRQQPNRRILWTRVNLRIHTWLVPIKALERSMVRAEARCPKKNLKRSLKGKPPKECKSLWSWLAFTVGEPPALLDTSKVRKAAEQMEIYLQKKGYFAARVNAEIEYSDSTAWAWKKRRKSDVVYRINPGEPYRYNSIQYVIEDVAMRRRTDDLKRERTIQKPDKS